MSTTNTYPSAVLSALISMSSTIRGTLKDMLIKGSKDYYAYENLQYELEQIEDGENLLSTLDEVTAELIATEELGGYVSMNGTEECFYDSNIGCVESNIVRGCVISTAEILRAVKTIDNLIGFDGFSMDNVELGYVEDMVLEYLINNDYVRVGDTITADSLMGNLRTPEVMRELSNKEFVLETNEGYNVYYVRQVRK